MATATSREQTSREQTLDYQHFIDYQLTRAQGRMKSIEVGTGIVRLITAAIAYLLVTITLDHVAVLPSGIRLVLLLAAVAAGLGYCTVAVLLPGLRRLNSFYTARTIEQTTPEFKNSLINFLDLRRRPKEIPPGVLSLLEERAVSDLTQIQVEEKINQDRLVRASYGLAGAVLVACVAVLINALLMHRSLADSLGRALFPTADIQPPTRTRLTDIKPGDKTVVAHTPVTISAVADGKVPDNVTLFWSDDDGRFWREQPLKQPERQFEPWAVSILVEKPIRYYLLGGDCQTREFDIHVTPPPMVTDLELIYDYPEYTGWARHTSRNGNIDALEGTAITLTAVANQAVSSGEIRFGSTKSNGLSMQRVHDRQDQLTAKFTVTKNDSYVIWFETVTGDTNPRPTSYEIKVRTDLPPTVSVKPGTDQVDPPVPANAILPIGVAVRDDFGIDEVKLNVAQGQDTLQTIDLTELPSAGKEFETTHRLDLEKLRLDGDEFVYWIDVADNRQPKRNRVSSPQYRVRLGSPLSPTERDDEEKRQVELAKAEDAEKAAQQAADHSPDDSIQQSDAESSDQPGQAPAESKDEQVPKDERAFDVIRKFLQEKEQEPQTEQARSSDQNQSDDTSKQPEPNHQGNETETSRQSKQQGNQTSKNDDSGESEGEKTSDESQEDNMSGSEKSAADRPSSQKAGENDSTGDKPDGDATGKEKRDVAKSSGQKTHAPSPDKSKDGSADDKSEADDETGDDGSGSEEQTSQKSDSVKPEASKPGASDKDEPNSKGESMKGRRSAAEKAKPKSDEQERGTTSRAESEGDEDGGQDRPSDPQAGSKVDRDKTDGDKSSRTKSGTERPSDDDSPRDQETRKEKHDGSTTRGQSDQGEPKGDKQHGKSPKGKTDDQNGETTGDKSPADAPSGAKPDGDTTSSHDTSDDGQAATQKVARDEPGTEDSGGDKQPGDQAGGKRSDGKQADGKAGADQKPDAGKSGGEKAGGDKQGGEKADSGQQGGEKAGDSSSGDSKGDSSGLKGSSGAKPQGKKSSSSGQGSSPGGGKQGSSERTETPQPGGGPNRGQGPVRKNDPLPEDAGSRGSAMPDFSDEGSALVLERLSKQLDKGEVDPELLKRLGWTREELEQFVKEFQGPGTTDPNHPNAGGESRSATKATEPGRTTLDHEKVGSVRRAAGRKSVDPLGDNYEGRRAKPAPEYEDHVRAYNMSQSKSSKATSQPAAPKSR